MRPAQTMATLPSRVVVVGCDVVVEVLVTGVVVVDEAMTEQTRLKRPAPSPTVPPGHLSRQLPLRR